jgi:hypothetical protein
VLTSPRRSVQPRAAHYQRRCSHASRSRNRGPAVPRLSISGSRRRVWWRFPAFSDEEPAALGRSPAACLGGRTAGDRRDGWSPCGSGGATRGTCPREVMRRGKPRRFIVRPERRAGHSRAGRGCRPQFLTWPGGRGRTWYPQSFRRNRRNVTGALLGPLRSISWWEVRTRVPRRRIVLLGFSSAAWRLNTQWHEPSAGWSP